MEELDRLEVDRRESAQNYNRGYMKDYRQQSNVRGFSLATQAVNRMKEAGQGGELTPDVYASYQSRHSQEDKIKEAGKDFLNATWINYLVSFSLVGVGVLLTMHRSIETPSLPTLQCKSSKDIS
jgi:hypothetical protein